MMKKVMLVMLVVCLAMAAPAMAAVGDVDWDGIGDGGTTVVDWLEGTGTMGRLEVYNGSTLRIDAGADLSQNTGQDSYIGGDGGGDHVGTGTVIHTGGSFAHGDDVKCTDGGPAIYKVQGGSVFIPGYLETNANCLFEFSGGSFISGVEDGEQVRDSGATFRVIGNGATLIQFDAIGGGNANYEFVPNAAGLITPITSGDTQGATLNVNLDALTGPSTMTLFTGGWVDVFDLDTEVTITQGATTLTPASGEPNEADPLLVNEYYLSYPGDVGMDLQVNVPDLGNPLITADPLGYQWLTGGTKTVAMTAEVRNFVDGIDDHVYTYSVAAGSPTTGATFAATVETNITATGVDLSADVTFTTAGDYILEVEVMDPNDSGVPHYFTDTVSVHVYEDGCEAAKGELSYDETEARTIGDTNYDCKVDLVDFAAMAENWLIILSL